MRIISAREQYVMLAPWRMLALRTSKTFTVPIEVADHHRMFDATDETSPMFGGGDEGHDVGELADSIRRHGVMEPLVMSTNGTHGVIEDGNHRLAAAKQVGLSHVPMRLIQTPKVSGPELHPHMKALLAANPGAVGDWDLEFPP